MADLYLDSIEVCRRLSAACKAAGSQKLWAEKHGVSASYVSDVVNALRPPGQSILDALGLVRIVRYRAKSAMAPKGKKEEEEA